MINPLEDFNEYYNLNYSKVDIASKWGTYPLEEELKEAYKLKGTKKEALDYFYRNTEMYYPYGLIDWEIREDRPVLTNKLIKFCKEFCIKSVFDFGMGIGSDAIPLAKEGIQVSGCEIGKHVGFLKWRIEKHKCDIKVYDKFPDIKTDMVILIAVLEHVWEPVNLLTYLANYTKYFSWIIDLHEDSTPYGMHCIEFYDELKDFTYKGDIDRNGVRYERIWSDQGRPQFYRIKIL
jgi:2-polyprenyl-3-methyl-5-hydroxy-6-metoxy-1,4-benzoquinol methylase